MANHHIWVGALVAAVGAVPTTGLGQEADGELAPEPETVRFRASGTFQYLAETDLDGGGTVDITRLNGAIGADIDLGDTMDLAVDFSFEFDQYDFGGVSDLGADPWDDIQFLAITSRLTYTLNDQWILFGGPVMQFAREDGADWGDAVTGGGIFGATYVVNEDLVIGGGLGIVSKLEDDVLVFPVLAVEWKINDRWRLTSKSGPAGIVGVGLEVVYDIGGAWEAGLGARYEFRRFRLDDNGVAPGGVGEETSIPLWGRVSYEVSDRFTVDCFLGIGAAGTLELETSSGGGLADADYDPAFLIALVGRVNF